MINFIKKDWPLLILLVIPFVFSILVFPYLPEQIPTHWNIQGQPDKYSSKEFGAFFLPIINLIIYVLFILIPYLDPKKANYQKFLSSYSFLRYIIHFFFLLIYSLTIAAALGFSVDIGLWISASISVLFIAIGNVLGRVRHNYFIGFKLPWTLANEEVWRKTHLLGAKLMVAGGFFGLIGVLLTEGIIRFIVLMTAIFVPSIITTIYSFLYYKRVQ